MAEVTTGVTPRGTRYTITKIPPTRVTIPSRPPRHVELAIGRRLREAESRRLETARKEIERERNKEIWEAKQRYHQDLRQIKGIQARHERLEQMGQEIGQAQAIARMKRLESGIITGATIGKDIQVRPEQAIAMRKALEDKPLTREEVTRLEKIGVKFERVKKIEPTVREIEEPTKVSFLKRIPEKWEAAQKVTRERVTYKFMPETRKVFGTEEEAKAVLAKYRAEWERQKDWEMKPYWTPLQEAFYGGVKGAYEMVRERPLTTAAWIGAGVAVRPAIVGVGWGAKAVGITPAIAKVPTVAKIVKGVGVGVKYGLPTAYGISKTIEIHEAPTAMEKGEVVGRISVELGGLSLGDIYGTKIATRITSKREISEAIKLLKPEQKIKYKEYLATIKRLQKLGVPDVKKVTLQGMDRIPSRARKPIIDHLKKISAQGDILGGSIAARTQTYGIKRSYAQSDLDLYTKGSVTSKAKALADSLKTQGIQRVSTVNGKVTIAGKKIAEFHPMEAYAQNIYEIEGFFKPVSQTITTTPAGITVMKLGTQGRRKLVASFLQGRYEKDYPDFIKITRSLAETARIQAPEKVITPAIEKAPVIKAELFKKIPPIKEYPPLYKPLAKVPYVAVAPYQQPYELPSKYPAITIVSAAVYPKKAPVPYTIVGKLPPTYKAPYKAPKEILYAPPIKPPYKPPIKPPYKVPPIKPPYRPPTKRPPLYLPLAPPKKPPIEPPIKAPTKIRRRLPKIMIKQKVQAWIAQIKRRGKWIPIGKPVVKPEAIRIGAERVRKTLAATFRVRPVKEFVAMKPILFKPSPKVFRAYKIVKGKRVPLKEEWIQRRPFRLAARAEVREIQIARRVKQKKAKWL